MNGHSEHRRVTGRCARLGAVGLTFAVVLLGCDSSNPVVPVEPSGSETLAAYSIKISASPTEIFAGTGGATTLSIEVREAGSDKPAADGSRVKVTTSLGEFGTNSMGEPIQQTQITVNHGRGSVKLFPGDAPGIADVLASFGGSLGGSSVPILDLSKRPIAKFSVVVQGTVAVFTDESTGGPTQWHWDFGDPAKNATSSAQNPSHDYQQIPTAPVVASLTVSNSSGQSTITGFVTFEGSAAGGVAPVANFSAEVLDCFVNFTDTSTGAPTSWIWTFPGDSTVSGLTTSTEQNPVVEFQKDRFPIQVTLQAANSAGTSSRSKVVGQSSQCS